jgi:hypothetical protein
MYLFRFRPLRLSGIYIFAKNTRNVGSEYFQKNLPPVGDNGYFSDIIDKTKLKTNMYASEQ